MPREAATAIELFEDDDIIKFSLWHEREPEMRLLMGLMERVVLDLQLGPEERREAVEWIEDDESTDETPFSLAFVCSELGVVYAEVRARLDAIIANDPELRMFSEKELIK